ncbi:integrase [Bacillus sp. M6-12]|uniref:tyrosine-type recombinase/integrase n=1 Tax=Bacillus sp. M6-12 TaxID=2054166 RepID=UPI000C783B31|nr:site-specific integrase [Bacillus sp. M6-12]PLS18167.1 integrase [Bacillus sp. M6-12]
MLKITITPQSTLEEAYLDQEQISNWSPNSKRAYRKNIKDITNHMISNGLHPILENVTYEYCQVWKNDQAEKVKPATLKQQKSTLSSLFRHLNHAKIIDGNPFLTVKITDYTEQQYLSKDLDINELYQVYKAAHELQVQGINVLAPILLDIFTGFRSTNLISLQAQSIDKEAGGIRIIFSRSDKSEEDERKREVKTPNTKNRETFIPLPPRVLAYFLEYTKGMHPEDPLLYGLRGKAFANKQMNYIVLKICKHLGWITETPDSEPSDGLSKKAVVGKKTCKQKTSKYFTPHGLRYSVATTFHEMGVLDNAKRLLLLHSKKAQQGALERYLRRDTKEVKELRMAQILLETVLQTALDMEDQLGVQMNLNVIYENLPATFQAQMNNMNHVHSFKQNMIRFTMSVVEQKLAQTVMPNQQNIFPEGSPYPNQTNHSSQYSIPSSHPFPRHYQGGYQASASAPINTNFYANQQDVMGLYHSSISPEFFAEGKR